MVTASPPIKLPEGDDEVLVRVATLEDWLWLHSVRSLDLPLPDDRRLQETWVSCLYVPTKRDKDLLKGIEVARARGGGNRRRVLAIDGDTDLGKTDLVVNMGLTASTFDRGRPSYRDNHRLHLPVLFAEADPKMDGLGLLRSIANFARLPTDGDIPAIGQRLSRELPMMGTTTIVVDDGHMLRRTSRRSTALPDALRVALRLPVTFVFVGAGLDGSALLQGGVGNGYESARQVRTRSTTWDVVALRWPEDKIEFEDMLKKFAGKVKAGIPSMTFSGLLQAAVRKKIYTQCGGQHAKIYCLLKDATTLAMRDGSRDVSADLLGRLWDQTPGEPHRFNPDDWPDDLAAFHAG